MQTLSKESQQRLGDVLSGRKTLREVKGLSDAQMEMLYGVGYALYSAGRCKEAIDVFQILCLYDPYVAKHWLGLAGSLERLGRNVGAALAYRMLLGIEPESPEGLVHGAEMELAAGDPRSAQGLVDRARRAFERRPFKESLAARLGAVESAIRTSQGGAQ